MSEFLLTPKETTLNMLRRSKGDDLERALLMFSSYSEERMDREYGQSGKTCREVVQEYQDTRDLIEDAIQWVESKEEMKWK